jgi:hypothetical protein
MAISTLKIKKEPKTWSQLIGRLRHSAIQKKLTYRTSKYNASIGNVFLKPKKSLIATEYKEIKYKAKAVMEGFEIFIEQIRNDKYIVTVTLTAWIVAKNIIPTKPSAIFSLDIEI